MARELTPAQLIERSIQKKYRKALWTPFILAVKRYALIREGDRVAVCVRGDGNTMLLAKLVQLLERYSDVPLRAIYMALDPGGDPESLKRLEESAALLGIPLERIGANAGEHPSSGARLSRLYAGARTLGCNKIALGQCFSDVVESTVAAMLYGGRLRGVMPKERSVGFEGMELIRPLYCVHEEDIAAWRDYNRLEFAPDGNGGPSGRQAVRRLLKTMRRDDPDIEKSVFNAIHAVSLDTFPAWRMGGETHGFLESYDQKT